jgi:hypothetical protein
VDQLEPAERAALAADGPHEVDVGVERRVGRGGALDAQVLQADAAHAAEALHPGRVGDEERAEQRPVEDQLLHALGGGADRGHPGVLARFR